MIIAVILAAGKGSRVKRTDKPKQYLNIGEKPMLCYTVEKFLACRQIDCLVVAVRKEWIRYATRLLSEWKYNRIAICEGGDNRQESLYKALIYCKVSLNAPDDAIILSHDVARPFVTQEIINANIQAMENTQAVTTVIPVVDTIIQSEDGLTLSATTDRSQMYQVQTPQTFRLKQYLDIYEKMEDMEKMQSTDAAGMLSRRGIDIGLIKGDQKNIKITTDFDLQLAEIFIANIYP